MKISPGMVFGKLTVVRETERDARGNRRWLCQCECGKGAWVRNDNLSSGRTKTCGCLWNETLDQIIATSSDALRVATARRNRAANEIRQIKASAMLDKEMAWLD